MSAVKVSHEDFVVVWMTSKPVDDVVSETGMSKAAVKQRAQALRKAGVNLPRFKRPTTLNTLRIAQLNSLVKKYQGSR